MERTGVERVGVGKIWGEGVWVGKIGVERVLVGKTGVERVRVGKIGVMGMGVTLERCSSSVGGNEPSGIGIRFRLGTDPCVWCDSDLVFRWEVILLLKGLGLSLDFC